MQPKTVARLSSRSAPTTGSKPAPAKSSPTSGRSRSTRGLSGDPPIYLDARRRPDLHAPGDAMRTPSYPRPSTPPADARAAAAVPTLALADLLGLQHRGVPRVARHDDAVRRVRRDARELSRGVGGGHVVGAQRVHRRLRGDADSGRRPRRHARPQEGLHDRRRRCSSPRRPPADSSGSVGVADRGARAAGDRRGAADAGVAVDGAGRVPAEQARRGRQPVGRGRRARGGDRTEPRLVRHRDRSAGRGRSSSTCRSARCRSGRARRS